MKKSTSAVLLSTTVYALCATPCAWAAPAPMGTPAVRLAEVIVTAEKVKQNIQNVGMSVVALSASQLAERQLTNFHALAGAVAGLNYAPTSTGTPIFTLRGVGFNNNSLGSYPDVSLYLNEAPLPFPVLASHVMFDLQQVEVMEGPQGTLFGENATGGAINFIAAQPTKRLDAGGSVTYGRFNQTDTSGFISGPVTKTLQARFAFTTHNMDAWQHSYTRNARSGAQSYQAARLLLNWEPAATLRVHFDVNGWMDQSEPQAPQLTVIRPQAPSTFPPNIAADEASLEFPPKDALVADWAPAFAPHSNRQFYQASLRVDYNLDSAITLTSLTSYDAFKQRQSLDEDGTNLPVFNKPKDSGHINDFYQELRVANKLSDTLHWLVGADYQRDKAQEDYVINYLDDGSDSPSNFNITYNGVNVAQHYRTYAGFADVRYRFTKNWDLSLGGRYTNARDADYTCDNAAGDAQIATLFNFLGTVLGTTPFTPITADQGCFALNLNDVPGAPFVNALEQHNVSWRANLDYHVTRDTMVYGTVAKGYKAGGFPTVAPTTVKQLFPVKQESLLEYELGVKSTVWSGRAQVDGSAFYYDYRDKQILGGELDPIFGVLDMLINVPKSRIYGAQLQVMARPLNQLSLSASMTVMKSEVTSYSGINALGVEENFQGDPLPYTPAFSGELDAEYRFDLPGDSGMPFVGMTVRGQSNTSTVFNGDNITIPISPINRTMPGVLHPYEIRPYAVADARVGYASESGRWRVTIWGRNLFNKYYWTNVLSSVADVSTAFTGMPRMYGITFSYTMR